MDREKLDIRAPIFGQLLGRGTGLGWLRVAILVLLDSLVLVFAWGLADRLGKDTDAFSLLWGSEGRPGFLLPILAITIGIGAASGLYGTDDRRRGFFNLLRSLTLAQSVLLIIGYLYEPEAVISRSTFLFSWFFTLSFVFAERLLLHLAILQLRNMGTIRHPVCLLGQSNDIEKAEWLLAKTKQFEVRQREDLSWRGSKVKDWSDMINLMRERQVDEVFLCSPLSVEGQLFLYWELKTAGIHLRLLPVGIELPIQTSEIKMVNGIPTIRFRSPPIIGGDYWLKRLIDLAIASIVLILASPLFLLLAILIKLDSPGPVFYQQNRVGIKGHYFKVWKFRTMVHNAEVLQKQLEKHNEMQGGVMFKMKDDPRITRVGKFIRRYSLDELPQIINVFRGEMSLVGPRPFPLRDVEKFAEHHFIRQEVLPGITGLWQVSGRSDVVDFDDVFRLDMTYIQNWSVGLDFQILFMTIKAVLGKEGAY